MKIGKYIVAAVMMLCISSASLTAMDVDARRERALAKQRLAHFMDALAKAKDDNAQDMLLEQINKLYDECPELNDLEMASATTKNASAEDADGEADADEDGEAAARAAQDKAEKEKQEREQRTREFERLRSAKQDYDQIYAKPFKPMNHDGATVESQLALLKKEHAQFEENTFDFQYTRMLIARCRAVLQPTDDESFGVFMQELQKIDKRRFVQTTSNPEGLLHIESELLATVSDMARTAHEQGFTEELRSMFAQRYADSHPVHVNLLRDINTKIDERVALIAQQDEQRRERLREQEIEDSKEAAELAGADGGDAFGGVDAKIVHNDQMATRGDHDMAAALEASLAEQETQFGNRRAYDRKSAAAGRQDAQDQFLLTSALAKIRDDEDPELQQVLADSIAQAQHQAARGNNLLVHAQQQAHVHASQVQQPMPVVQPVIVQGPVPQTTPPTTWRPSRKVVIGGAISAVAAAIGLFIATKKSGDPLTKR